METERKFLVSIGNARYTALLIGDLSEEWLESWRDAFYDVSDVKGHISDLVWIYHRSNLHGFVEGYGETIRVPSPWHAGVQIVDEDGMPVAKFYVRMEERHLSYDEPIVEEIDA